ncbi:MAG TPA: hypothetical protein VF733_02950 [Candidatus Saccharimonadales bacterium]
MLSQLLQSFAADCSARYFLGLPSWDYYLIQAKRIVENSATGTCELTNGFDWRDGGDLVLILLGVLDILLRVAGIVAVAFIIYGGIQYITSDGAPDATKDAQQTIINALVGLVIALISAAAVSFIGNALSKPLS